MGKQEDVLIALRQIIRATDLHSKQLAREIGLTTPQLLLLQMTAQLGHPTIGRLAREANLTQATVTTIIERMEKRNLVSRLRNEADRRRVNVRPTAEGQAILDRAPAMLQHDFTAKFKALPEWEQNFLISALQRVASLMDADQLDASPLLDTGALDRLD